MSRDTTPEASTRARTGRGRTEEGSLKPERIQRQPAGGAPPAPPPGWRVGAEGAGLVGGFELPTVAAAVVVAGIGLAFAGVGRLRPQVEVEGSAVRFTLRGAGPEGPSPMAQELAATITQLTRLAAAQASSDLAPQEPGGDED